MNNKKTWIVIYFVILTAVGSGGFYVIGGEDWSILDSIYMTIITLASVGYGEVHPLNNYGKVWSILVIVFGVTGVGALIRVINEEFLQSQLFWKKNMKKRISKLKNHYVICGYGRMGEAIANELKNKGKLFLIIEKDTEKAEKINQMGLLCLNGDATSEDTFKDANIEFAIGIAVVLDTDRDNLFVTMSIKSIYPNIFLLSRCSKNDNQNKLIRAGANRVINPYTAGGHRMAEILAKPQVEDSISVTSTKHENLNLAIDEILLSETPLYNGVSIEESKIRENYDINIVGIIAEDGRTKINPDSSTMLNSSDTVLLIGKEDDLNRFKETLP